MSKKRELKERVESLGDIRDILAAMKNLSLVEIANTTASSQPSGKWSTIPKKQQPISREDQIARIKKALIPI